MTLFSLAQRHINTISIRRKSPRIFLLTALSIINFNVAALGQNANQSPHKDYLGLWINMDIFDKEAACRSIARGGDDDGMLIIRETTFRIYLPQSPCQIQNSRKISDNSISIEARCGGKLIKETWRLNNGFLERNVAKNSAVKYQRCSRIP